MNMTIEMLQDVITLFAILNPIGCLSMVVEMTRGMKRTEKAGIVNLGVIAALILLTVFSLIGQRLLETIFRISLFDLMAASGLILLVISIKSIVFERFSKDELGNFKLKQISAVPLAFPLLVGPGALVTGVLIVQRQGVIVSFFIFVAALFLSWAVLRFMDVFAKILGDLGTKVISKVMYVFLGAIAVKFIFTALREYSRIKF